MSDFIIVLVATAQNISYIKFAKLYTAISTFMPQLYVDRKKIKIRQDKANLYADLEVINLIDDLSRNHLIKSN